MMVSPLFLASDIHASAVILAWRERASTDADLHLDARQIKAGDVFLAVPGLQGDGRAYMAQAEAMQASLIVCHVDSQEDIALLPPATLPRIAVQNLKQRLGELSHVWYHAPSEKLTVVAITGTNGKTSCAQWVAQVLQTEGQRAGVIGTLGCTYPDGHLDRGVLTTPDVVTVHRYLARLRDSGAQFAVLEASSIGLHQDRLNHVRISVAAFTNLTRDHMDYHGDMLAYEQAKALLFQRPELKHAVINMDDDAGRRIQSTCMVPVITYAMNPQHRKSTLFADHIRAGHHGLVFSITQDNGAAQIATQALGTHNIANLLCVGGILHALGWSLKKIGSALSAVMPVDGRLQWVNPLLSERPMPQVVVDYAHTPDAMERALQAVRPSVQSRGGRLWCVFGCGGDRDPGKRPLMAKVACRLADAVVVTSDNPRFESPGQIIAEVLDGIAGDAAAVIVESDRAMAIMHAVMAAAPEDLVLLAGKGHETYQETKGVREPFDDREWARAAMMLLQEHAVESDTRQLNPGSVFIALRGETFDAHDYLDQAREAGAVAAFVEKKRAEARLPQIELGDTRIALIKLGQAWRQRFSLPVVAVTGSNGKTTTKEMISSIFAAWQGETSRLATQGNLNNEIGVPLTLLRLRAQHHCAVIELGMNHPDEIAGLARMAQPTVGLVNNAQREHQEFMHTVDAVARENGQVLCVLPHDGVAVFPADDPFTSLWKEMAIDRTVLSFGLSSDADVRATEIEADALGTSFLLHSPKGQARVKLSVPGMHNLRNALSSSACALAAGAPLDKVVRGLEAFHAVKGRMQVHRISDQLVVIDDTYNANPDSVRAAIDVLSSLASPRVLVLGDMGEVGNQGPAMHREVGVYAATQGVEHLLALGEATVESVQAFGEAGQHLTSPEEVAARIAAIKPASVLVKGSRFMRMERVVQTLLNTTQGVRLEKMNHAA